jgi:hypothetical protein
MRQVTFAVGLTALCWAILLLTSSLCLWSRRVGIARLLSVLGLMIFLGAAPAPPSEAPVKRRVIRLKHPKQPDAPRSLVAGTGGHLGFKQEDLTKNSSISDVSNGPRDWIRRIYTGSRTPPGGARTTATSALRPRCSWARERLAGNLTTSTGWGTRA